MQNILTTSEAAEYLRSSVITLEQWRQKGEGPPFYKPKGKIYYLKEDLDAWIKEGQQNQ